MAFDSTGFHQSAKGRVAASTETRRVLKRLGGLGFATSFAAAATAMALGAPLVVAISVFLSGGSLLTLAIVTVLRNRAP